MKYESSHKYQSRHYAKPMLADSALSWWNSMTFEEQFYKTIAWLKDQNRNVTERHPHKLSVDEIVGVYQLHLR